MSDLGSRPLGRVAGAGLVVIAALMPFAGQDVVLAAWCVTVLVLNLRSRIRLDELVVPVPVLLLLTWVTVSATWSVAPLGTLQGAAQSSLLVLGATLVVARRGLGEMVDVVALAMKALVVLTWVVGVVVPAAGRTREAYQAGSLEGPFAHRNLLAYVMVIALVTFVVRALDRGADGRGTTGSWWWAAAALVTVLATRSSTALVVLTAVGVGAVALVVVLVLRPGLRRLVVVPGLVVAGATLWWATANLDTVAQSVGRDPTLTGRTDIWVVVVRAISERPLQGYGWNALWHAGTPVTERMWAEGGFRFFHAHDGYLDAALQVGIVGLVLHLLVVGLVLVRSSRAYLTEPGPVRAWPLLVVAVVLAYNVSETVLPVNIGWLLVAALAGVASRRPRPASGTADTAHRRDRAPAPSTTRTIPTDPRARRDQQKV